MKFVINSPTPFIVPIANWSGETVQSADEPPRTITSYPKGGAFSVASPVLVGAGGPVYSGRPASVDRPVGTLMTANHRALASACIVQAGHGEGSGKNKRRSHGVNDICGPVGTVTASGGGQSIATALMVQANGGFNTTAAKSVEDPMTTVTNTGSQQQLVTTNLVHLRGNCDARDLNDPLHTISAGGTHHGLMTAFLERQFGASVGQPVDEPAPTITAGGGGKSSLVELQLSPEIEAGALRVAAFLISYYGTSDAGDIAAPAATITTRDRLALVTVTIKGTPYVIVDICLRMLQPAELYKAQASRPTTSSVTAPTASRSPKPSRCTCAGTASAHRRWRHWPEPTIHGVRSKAKQKPHKQYAQFYRMEVERLMPASAAI